MRRTWWFKVERRCIPFDEILRVGFIREEGLVFHTWRDAYDIIWLALQVRLDGGLVKLIPFQGEGSKETGIFGVLLGDSIIDLVETRSSKRKA